MAIEQGKEQSGEQPPATGQSAPAEDVQGSTRGLIIELAQTENAIRNTAAAGDPTETLAEREDDLLAELNQHGVGFRAVAGQDAAAAGQEGNSV
ncbi:hypothetical protein RBS60_04530 [Sinomonas sp. ASV486]|uniref:Uncharacterized protein n=1 Tax=Sinomonas puerhi TaxID=3238584 RepID=A0AB39L2R5_9MICC|nr:hypothetical protein [Sinomonas sp. ASV486]MDQ4489465.1 hypothetical protein [Sinomonas sp. ASV486]